MSRRKVAYAKKTAIDPEEEGEEPPFEPREIAIHKDKWVTRGFNIGELLGRGKFGEVKRCEEKTTGLKLAAKFITVHCDTDKAAVKREIEIQSKLHHNRILQIYDAFEKDRQMCIVMELVLGGELFDRVVNDNFDLTERVAILFMRQIVDGMAFIHSQNVIHLDMKPENIVCVATTGTRVKIIDFGLALTYNKGCGIRTMAGTLEFMAPEVANFEDVSPATDMWSVGVICYVLVSGLSPFLAQNDNETISNILRVKFNFDAEEFEAITDDCKDFIKQLLIKDPMKRLSANDCMKHKWLQKITRAQTTRHLSKKFHVKFFARRKWKKAIKAIIAMNRLERFSSMFMQRKSMSNTIIPGNGSPIPNRLRVRPSTSNPVPDPTVSTRTDWKTNLLAKKLEREQAKLNSKKEEDIKSNMERLAVGEKPCNSERRLRPSRVDREGGRAPGGVGQSEQRSRRNRDVDSVSPSSRHAQDAAAPSLSSHRNINRSRHRANEDEAKPPVSSRSTRIGRLAAISSRPT